MLVQGLSLDPTAVADALQDVLGSQFFRSSAQCSSLLRYMVENTLADRDELLRERVIGYEVFARAPDYDTGNDHIVRSRASEVRKRLAQYYQGPGAAAEIRISIPSGSYRATFDMQPTPSPAPFADPPTGPNRFVDRTREPPDVASLLLSPEPGPPATPALPQTTHVGDQRPRRVVAFIALAILLAAAAAAALVSHAWSLSSGTPFDAFWAPLNRSSKPALIYCGGGFVYKLSDQFLDAYSVKHGLKDTRREFFVDLKPGDSVPGSDLIPDRHFVPFGDLASTARVVNTLASFKKAYDLRYGDDLGFTEFRSSPVILIGGLNNSWALKVTRNLRYVLNQDDRIIDQWHPEKVWRQSVDPDNQARDDYAIISRLNSSGSATGTFVLSIAGIRMYGTRAAAELISDPAKLNDTLKHLPPGWETRNLQVVLHTRTLNEIPVFINVEALYSW